MKIFIFLLLFIPNLGLSASMNHIGEKGEPSEIDRVIKIEMFDNYFEPNEINIKKNETIKFLVHNYGSLVHEFNIGTKKMHLKHQPEMMKMMENGILLGDKIDYKKMKEIAKTDHSMAHSHSNSVLLEPSKSGEIIWKFNTEINLEAACNVPGHYENDMIIKINFN